MTVRRDALATALGAVHERVDTAMRRAERVDDVVLVVVTKYFPASDVEVLASLGVTDIGENRAQEVGEKIPVVAARPHLTVHFVGQLQTNKATAAARLVDVVQSVDRARLARALDSAAAQVGRVLDVTVQVRLDADPGRGGVAPEGARELADLVAGCASLRLRGVMAVAPLGEDPRSAFGRLRAVADTVREDHPDAEWMSAGMSGDLEYAIAEGATHLRVGSAILGSRPSQR
ncbi:MAG: YggS family pyridoxal phosphate-dependent enzyme [Dermatophilaceae bacterium]